jgi:hypothetical protein
MATEFCRKCKQSHPGRTRDYDDKGDCAETMDVEHGDQPHQNEPSNQKKITRRSDRRHRHCVPPCTKAEDDSSAAKTA